MTHRCTTSSSQPTLLPGVLISVDTSSLSFQKALVRYNSHRRIKLHCILHLVLHPPLTCLGDFPHISTYNFSVRSHRLCRTITSPLVSNNEHLVHMNSCPSQCWMVPQAIPPAALIICYEREQKSTPQHCSTFRHRDRACPCWY